MNAFWQFDMKLSQVVKREQIYPAKDFYVFPFSGQSEEISYFQQIDLLAWLAKTFATPRLFPKALQGKVSNHTTSNQ